MNATRFWSLFLAPTIQLAWLGFNLSKTATFVFALALSPA
jgi:hypothetical protein